MYMWGGNDSISIFYDDLKRGRRGSCCSSYDSSNKDCLRLLTAALNAETVCFSVRSVFTHPITTDVREEANGDRSYSLRFGGSTFNSNSTDRSRGSDSFSDTSFCRAATASGSLQVCDGFEHMRQCLV